MRKIKVCFALLTFAGTLLSCITEGGGNPDNDADENTSYIVAVEDARAGVENLLEDIDVQTRGGSRRAISETIISDGLGGTRSMDGEEKPLYYIFNFENDAGFAIASGDLRTPPIFCVTDSGHFDLETIGQNQGLLLLLMSYDTDYRVTTRLPVEGPNQMMVMPGDPNYPPGTGWAQPKFDKIAIGGSYEPVTSKVGPWSITGRHGSLIAAQWGQDTPYNDKFPFWKGRERSVAGCGTTAVAQILYHWRHPSSINGKTLDWGLISRHRRRLSDDDELNHQPAHESIATLFQELSKSKYLNASYSSSSDKENLTSVEDGRIAKTFRKLGFQTNDESKYKVKAVMDAMKRNMPVIVGGYSYRKKFLFWYIYSGGHFWIFDHLITRERKTEWYRGDKLFKTETTTQDLLHCNWGWDGGFNGYYLPTEFNTNNAINPEATRGAAETKGAAGYYQYDITMWDWIRL